jgi:carbonic anhydrase
VRVFGHFAVLLSLLSGLSGCDKVQALIAPPKAAPSAEPSAQPGKTADAVPASAGEKAAGEPDEYALPFAWESSAAEPLGRTRSFLKDMFATNADYMTLEAKQFAAFADKQSPRVTVLTCADSRVQTTAFDATPENDDFVVRNLGNQIELNPGSVEYGVEQLETPLLLILGHTGCGAVRSAMGTSSKLPATVQDEIKRIHAPTRDPRDNDRDAWVHAVNANVHDQVTAALARFGRRVHAGRLTIVGAVLDLRNDIGLGAGRLVVVDVNGNQDQKRIAAFIEAVTGRGTPEAHEPKEAKGEAGKNGRTPSTADLLHALAALPPADAPKKSAAAPVAAETAPVAAERAAD